MVKNYKWNWRPHKDTDFLIWLFSILDNVLIKEFISKIYYLNFNDFSEAEIYNINRVFLQMISSTWNIEEVLETNYFKNSDFWMKQKILEKAIDSSLDLDKYPFLITFINKIKKLSNKSNFQEELLAKVKVI